MSATRSRKEEKTYKNYLKLLEPGLCVFCHAKDEELVRTTKHFKIIRNIFAYSIWDGQDVKDHLMVIPHKHVDSVAHFTDNMVAEYHKLLGEYEQQGYNIYARAPASKIKSVVHQHTHLIRTEGAAKNLILLMRKPYYFRVAA
ncbi:MAG TPA: hypothetical protein VHC98_03875 [Candidatus Saccharimonadales bacterium]|nr:hypothetical protein [Candidatus Saccharimonadales bacterium]